MSSFGVYEIERKTGEAHKGKKVGELSPGPADW